MRHSWIEVDLDAVRDNVRALVVAAAPASVCAVVKADGYGHGDVPVAFAAVEAGAGWLAVALVEEGVRLREAGVEAPILVLSEPRRGDAAEVVEWGLTPTVYTQGMVDELAQAAGEPTAIHVKVDTGMHRVGADPADVPGIVARIEASSNLNLGGLWTHFAVAEEDRDYTLGQLARFHEVLDGVASAGTAIPMRHAANSAGALAFPEARLDMVRTGLAVYGLRPAPGVGSGVALRPAMRVISEVSAVRRLPAGERLSYGRRRPMPAVGWVATVPIGYADGVVRRLSHVGGEVLIGGSRRPFAGTVTMDQIVVDCGDHEVSVGDEVVLIGRQGSEEVTADEWAGLLDTINYEIVCNFGPRLPRRYVGGAS